MPITLALVVLMVGLHLAVAWKTTPEHDRSAVQRELGLLEILKSSEHPELSGPFDLWKGQWWRIPIGALHHAGVWHLGLGVAAVLYLGWFLESKISRASYGCFLLGALLVTTIPRWLGSGTVPAWFVGNPFPTGIWGVAFALLGALVWLRRNDRRLSRQFGEGAILLGIIVGLGSMAFATIGLIDHIDNLAHLAGFPYGLVWGMILSAPKLGRWFLVPAFVAVHALFVPLVEGLMHPVENGRYQWWLAEQTDDPDLKRTHYRMALEHDPSLQAPWLLLAELEFRNDQPAEAWRILVEGLEQHPDLQDSDKLSWRIWSAFSTPEERRTAWQVVGRQVADGSLGTGDLLSPAQSAAFLLEEKEPLQAWASLMQHLRGVPSPADANAMESQSQSGEVSALVKEIWSQLETESDRLAALEILDQLLGPHRRAWQLAIVPRRDLIRHYQSLGEAFWAWELLMEELRDDPAFHNEGKQIAGEIWRMFPTELRRERARNIVDEVFGAEGLSWQIDLGILSEALKERYRLDQAVQLPPEPIEPRDHLIPLSPNDPESAAAGTRL